MPLTVVPTSFATVAIETFMTALSSVIRNCPAASVRSISLPLAARTSLIVIAILLLTTRIADAPPEKRTPLAVIGAIIATVGLSAFVFGVLRSGVWGWIEPALAAYRDARISG